MTTPKIRQTFIEFMKERGHVHMPPSSLVPEGDPSVLFTTAGMQQFKPYYTQPELAPAPRVCSIQPSFRTSDIEEVGDNRHLTMFEMLGNFSFGYRGNAQDVKSSTPYFKEVAITLAFELITKKFKIDLSRLYVTVYQGNEEKGIPRDDESAEIWKKLGIRDIRYEDDDNFWGPTGSEGPCGPTTEIYADDIEIWNLVFNQFYADANGKLTPLEFQGVDTGSGLERLAAVLQNKREVFDTDLFAPIIKLIEKHTNDDYYSEHSARIIADHLKASMFLIADGIRPSNKAQGYVLRRLIRRLSLNASKIHLSMKHLHEVMNKIHELYSPDYDRLSAEYSLIELVLNEELAKFERTLKVGLKEFEKTKAANEESHTIPGEAAFKLFDTFGFPIELTQELAQTDGYTVDMAGFEERFKTHQETSRAGLDKVFKGGLADHEPATVKHHTAHHLLLAALRQVLGTHVFQRGSNVTGERLRIDFSHPEKVTPEQLQQVEAIVNQAISEDLEVRREEMPREEAEKLGALAEFGAKYGDTVTVYTIFNKDGSVFSREFCGGPHVGRTSELGLFSVLKEEASSAGIRRIKAKTS